MSMGLDVVLECENNWQTELTAKIVHRSHSHRNNSKLDNIKGKWRSKYNNLNILDGDFLEWCVDSSPSIRRKSMPSRPVEVNLRDNEVHKRGSMYHSSREVRRMRKLREGRRNLELSRDDDAFLSFEIVDSLSQPCKDEVVLFPQKCRSPLVPLNAEPSSSEANSPHLIPTTPVEFLDLSFRHLPEEYLKLNSSCSDVIPARHSFVESLPQISLHPEDEQGLCPEAGPGLESRSLLEDHKYKSDQILCHENERKTIHERGMLYSRPMSLSAKIGLSDSPYQSERSILKTNSKTRFSPLKKILNPIMRSKSLRNSLTTDTGTGPLTDPASKERTRVFQKSPLNDLSNATQNMEFDDHEVGVNKVPVATLSPAHLHGTLKLEFKHGVPYFEFTVKDPEDVLLAKTWKTENEYNWVYTFHSCKKKGTNSGWGAKDRSKQSPPMIGQMHVSCYLCSQVSDCGSLDNSMVTEFILHDIAQARRSICSEERPHFSFDNIRPADINVVDSLYTSSSLEGDSSVEPEKCRHPARYPVSDSDLDISSSEPWSPIDLHSQYEIAAVVIQIPFGKKECFKDKQVELINSKRHPNFSITTVDQVIDNMCSSSSPASMKVITSSGTHGMPNNEEGGPSSLLDRWRFGGGCDCGGWDMACPLVIFENNNSFSENVKDCSTSKGQLPVFLFVQGKKDKVPALSIMADEKGQYSVEFHAQLSVLQAFSICIAILHSSEASSVVGQEKSRHRLYSDSLRLQLEEEVRHLIEAVKQKEKRRAKKKGEQIPASFLLDPPFSPMGRV